MKRNFIVILTEKHTKFQAINTLKLTNTHVRKIQRIFGRGNSIH